MTDEGRIMQCTVVLTLDCNLRCNFCFEKCAGYTANDRIDYVNLKRIVDFCNEANVKYLFLTGGEPLMYPRLIDILKYIKEKQYSMSIAIATNGTLLKDFEFCRRLADYGVSYIDISMKGKNAQEWLKTTGYDGSMNQLQAIRNLSALPVEFTCSMVITPENVRTFCESVQLAHDNGARQFSFTFVIDNDDTKEKGQAYLEKHNPFALVNAFLAQIDHLNAITEEWWIEYSFPMCVYTEEQLSLLKGKLAAPCQIHMRNAVTFNTKMELLPCDMYINQKMGQFGTDFSTYQGLERLMKHPTYRGVMEALQDLPSRECISCQHMTDCYGGCPVLWKNYSFEALKAFKEKHLSSENTESRKLNS